jgi:predicted ATPase/transcriptional regulator with XRE-family HTH domain
MRLLAGMSREALAERSGISVATLAALEGAPRRRPFPNTVLALAEALDLAPAERGLLLELASDAATSPRTPLTEPPPVATIPAARVRLPVPPTTLISRDTEVASATALLDPSGSVAPLLTLLGSGGVGKTRLALAVAAALVDMYADGVVFVDLAALRDHTLVPATIAHALAVRESSRRGSIEQLLAYLRDRQMLLVLDNFEHLLEARTLVLELLQQCPRLALLITSRAPLRLQGERRVVVGPLSTPAVEDDDSPAAIASSPAVQLFAERARATAAEFSLTANNAATVASICRRLDGLPLAIELAAARVRQLTPATLLGRLEPRLALLTGGGPDLPQRQQTLRATLEWSAELLQPSERAVFQRLAVFAGGWSVEAAEAVATDADLAEEDVLDALQALVDSSLIHRSDDRTAEPRFVMLETVREYALEQLEAHQEAAQRSRRHAAYFLTLAEQAEPELRGADQRSWFDRLDRELGNLRVALAWARSAGDLELGLRLANALSVFYEERGHVREGAEWLDTLVQMLSTGDAPPHLAPLRARALATAAWLEFFLGDYERAAPLAQQSLAQWRKLGQVGNSPVALNVLAYVARRDGDLVRQDALFRESLALSRAQGDTHGTAEVLSWLGTQQRAAGDLDGATALLDESLQLYRTTGTLGGIAYVLLHLGGVARARHDAARAQMLFTESMELYASLGDRSDVAYATCALAALAADEGDLPRARALCDESVATFRVLGDLRGLTEELRLLGRIAWLQGDDRSAAAAFAEVVKLSQAVRKVDLAFSLEGLALAVARMAARAGPADHQLSIAVRLLGAAAALRDGLDEEAASPNWSVAIPAVTHPEYADQVARIRTAMGGSAFDAAWSAGRQLSADEATAEALAAVPE